MLVKLYKSEVAISKKYILDREITNGQSVVSKGVFTERNTGVRFFLKYSSNKKQIIKEFNNQLTIYNALKNESIVIPKPISVETYGNVYVLKMDYFDKFELLSEKKAAEKIESYLFVLEKIGKIKTKAEIKRKNFWFIFCSLPILFALNSIYNFSYIKTLTYAVVKLLKQAGLWYRIEYNTLTHGDFNSSNILVGENKFLLLDFSELCISHYYSDLAQALNSNWQDQELQNTLLVKIKERFNLDEVELHILMSFTALNLMQRLCKRYENKKQSEFYISKLKLITDML